MTTDTSTPQWSGPLSGTRRARTLIGDTPERIALRETGDAANWYTLIWLNGLRAPYITDNPAHRSNTVLLAGQDEIVVPATGTTPTGVADSSDLFGTDIALTGGVVTAAANGDLATVSGVPNLVQAVDNRMASLPGDLVYEPSYGNGVYALLGRSTDPINADLAGVFVGRCISADPRIDSIVSITVGVNGDSLDVDGQYMTIGGKSVPVGGVLTGGGN
ncbi:hypothetical protein LDL36_20545 [Komagataeibacter sp. FNDCR1]|nr:hypothetical protein [Komagataeibacter sp. FNDCR1]